MLDTVDAALRKIEEAQEDAERLEVPADASPLDFLCAVYRDAQQPMNRRLKAASEAAQYVHPTFKATAIVAANGDFAARLEAAIARSAGKVIEAKPEPLELPSLGPTPTDMSAPFLTRRRA